MSERYGSAPSPENKTLKRPVFCFNCKRLYLSRAISPKCWKCGSYKVIDYKSVNGSIDVLQIKQNIDEIANILQKHEVWHLKTERTLELQKTNIEKLNDKVKELLPAAPKVVKKGEHPGQLDLNLEYDEFNQRFQMRRDELQSLRKKHPQPQTARKQTNPGISR
ncbi:hypothetical protein [Methanosarcina mazei]|uniref:Uncharacterized protein n=1 Tax=Methanosarcina mazei TaxID=2209 RepID=A0A0F8HVG7_METMZ|nr:hypothetical protein [Methanosarcina mazei]KKG70994.1 hypothetical protein DU63_05815 [Methanosarcina mazei]